VSGPRRDLLALWRTRRTSGFPVPFRWSLGAPSRRAAARQWLTGYPWYSAVPLRRQVLGIPARPVRYARMVRGVARARGENFQVADLDSVP
jgi:hypothetical protein